jgi:hypothetical protein
LKASFSALSKYILANSLFKMLYSNDGSSVFLATDKATRLRYHDVMPILYNLNAAGTEQFTQILLFGQAPPGQSFRSPPHEGCRPGAGQACAAGLTINNLYVNFTLLPGGFYIA